MKKKLLALLLPLPLLGGCASTVQEVVHQATAVPAPVDAIKGPQVPQLLVHGEAFDGYCDGDLTLYERYFGEDNSGAVAQGVAGNSTYPASSGFVVQTHSCQGKPSQRVQVKPGEEKTVTFTQTGREEDKQFTVTLFCSGTFMAYERNSAIMVSPHDPRCSKH